MSEKRPLLSICISTYNRFFYLNRTLRNITSAPVFTETKDIEVVVSDNGSTDKTSEIIAHYVSKYPDKIRTFRNETNTVDKNMETVLQAGRGKFLKLHNDTLLFKENGLLEMLDKIRHYEKEKPVLFFDACNEAPRPFVICNNADDFMQYASFYCTWIGGFGIWKTDFDNLTDFSRYAYLRLPQTDVLLRLLANGKKAVVFHGNDFFNPVSVVNKTGYNHAEVFGKNYNAILKEFLGKKIISQKTYKEQKKEILIRHIFPNYFDFKKRADFKKGNFFKFTRDYHFNVYFWLSFFKIALKKIKQIIYLLLFKNKIFFDYYWRKHNKHNQTYPLNEFKLSKVRVGNRSTGGLKILFHGFRNDGLFIGNDVHIGENVVFQGAETAAAACPIFIDDDVTIPDGSVITAGTVLLNNKGEC